MKIFLITLLLLVTDFASAYRNMNVDIPASGSTVSGSDFLIAGWAVDTDSTAYGSGIYAIHVWAYDTTTWQPTFAGAGYTGIYRPDVGQNWLGWDYNYTGFGVNAHLPQGNYYVVVYALSAASWTWDARALYVNVPCQINAPLANNCSVKVMDVPHPAYAYNMNVTHIPGLPNPYLAIFTAENYNTIPTRNIGDSTGAKYGAAFNFGTHNYQQDLAITRPQGSYEYPDGQGGYGFAGPWPLGASNPQLIQIQGNWVVYWLSTNPVTMNNHLMFSFKPYGDIGNIFSGWWATYSKYDSYLWSWSMVYQPLADAGDVRKEEGGTMVSTDNNGLLGTMTTGPDDTVYFYYTELIDGQYKFFRRIVRPYLTWMSPPEVVSHNVSGANVYYHKDLNQWVALYYCMHPAGRYDICARRFYDSMLTSAADGGGSISSAGGPNDYASYGLRFDLDPNIPWWTNPGVTGTTSVVDITHNPALGSNYALHQPGFRRNAKGQLFRDQDGDVIVYVTVKQPIQFGGDNVTGDMYAKSVFLTPR